MSPLRAHALVAAALIALGPVASSQADDARPFAIRVVDESTGRGVPLVELTTTNALQFVTDSAGYIAIDDPGLLDRDVFFHVRSHGYEFPADGFGYRGKRLHVAAGEEATLRLKRINLAERLYRVTGEGIYADSVKLGKPVPLKQPLLSGGVVGQDSNQAAVVGERIYWFWGDTSRLSYPLGNFGTSGALSRPPEQGGLPPEKGVDLEYFVDEKGFSRPMFQLGAPGVVWLDGVAVVDDAAGKSTIIGHYSRREGLAKQLAHGIAAFDAEQAKFEPVLELPEEAPLFPHGHAVRVKDDAGVDWIYFGNPYPNVRVRARWEDVVDPAQYEALVPAAGSAVENENKVDGISAVWKRGAPPLTVDDERRLIETKKLSPETALWQTRDASTGNLVRLQGGSVRWNRYRNRWVMIAVEVYGKPSMLGEVWYAEAPRPEGPWDRAVRIVTHDKYSFYNPVHHEFFDEDNGRVIYFEGTYTQEFSGAPQATPRYNYNQVMYRLDLSDPRLRAIDPD